ncbi:MAG: preprotein translocase subunit YajC [Nitrospirae bacterium]|nr:preprotein translocase subunit YajC [Nitrospirota bacterium]
MFESVAYAMGAPGGGAGGQGGSGGMIMMFVQLAIIFGILYFLLIRPQQKKAKEHKAMLDNLKKGDKVLTTGGIYGTIFSIDQNTVVLIVSENVKIKMARGYIAALEGSEGEAEKPA